MSITNAVKQSIRDFCDLEIETREHQAAYKKHCENANVSKSTAYLTLSKVMNDDDIDILELPSGGFVRKTNVKTQCTVKRELVLDAVAEALERFAKEVDNSVDTLVRLVKEVIREHRVNHTTRIIHVDTLPKTFQGVDIPRASGYISNTINTWMASKQFLSDSLAKHKEAGKQLKERRETALKVPGVQEYMKRECVGGKNVRIDGCEDAFTLRYADSCRRRPILEKHLQDAIQHAIHTCVRDVDTIPDAAQVANLIMDTAIDSAGVVNTDTFTLSAKSGRKRAVDGSIK
jgi:galactitol-specific phosphotransferase system IIB component